jgi:Preprotein translocase subunit SecY
MRKLIETIQNIWKIEELRQRILFTLLMILCIVSAPSWSFQVSTDELANLQNSSNTGLLGLLNMFSGGAFGNASIFALGIMPYITASIIIQLLGMVIPYFQRLQREGEVAVELNQVMRYLTVGIVIVQAPGYIRNVIYQLPNQAVTPFDPYVSNPGVFFWISSIILLCAGTLFIMWLGEKITDKGIGNGISLIIMIGIIARLPGAFVGECAARFTQGGAGLLILVIELVVLFFVMVGTIALVQGTRKTPGTVCETCCWQPPVRRRSPVHSR